jgi:NtrC-family two-component system sensor histidine kinase KinB
MGAIPAGWAAFLGAILTTVVRYQFSEQLGVRRNPVSVSTVAVTLANASIHTLSILVGGYVYTLLGNTVPLKLVGGSTVLALILLGLVYLVVNLLLAGLYIASQSKATLQAYIRSLPNLLTYEAGPLVFAPLMAMIYTELGWAWFVLFSLSIILASLIAWNLAQTSQRLERRVQELDSLQAVGQALSASLVLDDILKAIYVQAIKLMPVNNFYVALYYPEENEVQFPLAVEDREFVAWKSRKAGYGLTEHILKTAEPLLIRSNVSAKMQELGIEQVGRPAASWLGVPILSAEEPLGVIAVQSQDEMAAFDESHQEILVTIAAQAAVAIQNARLYEQTDESLALRVQELNSIIRTTTEGVLLLDVDWQILAANRALADFFGLTQIEFAGGNLESVRLDQEHSLLSLMGYTNQSLEAECQHILSSGERERKKIVKVHGLVERHLERTLTPVRDRENEISGWLLVFRDMTEEIELARLREDMTHMLVHDLRTPLTSLKGSLWLLTKNLADVQNEQVHDMMAMSERSVDRIVDMVNSLLDIAKLEIGQMPLHLRPVAVPFLLEEAISRVKPLAEEAQITTKIQTDGDLPPISIDPDHIKRVLTNLLDNAIKFTPDHGSVHLWARPDSENGHQNVLLGVTDTGPGIPKNAQKNLFQKFQQVVSIEGRRKGTGLGLAYCKLVVDAHGGEIWVDSQEGKGATFSIRIPINTENHNHRSQQ